jgi:hypothetical protein
MPAQYFTLGGNAQSRPFVQTAARMENAYLGMIGANTMARPNVQLELTGSLLGSFFFNGGMPYTIRPGIKWQFVGPTTENLTDKGSRASVFAHLVNTHIDASGNQSYLFGPGGFPWSMSTDLIGVNAGVSYGERYSQNLLWYVGAAAETYNISAKIHQDATSDGAYPAVDASIPTTNGRSTALSMGLIWGVNKQFELGYSYVQNNWNNLSSWQHAMILRLQFAGPIKATAPLQPVQ